MALDSVCERYGGSPYARLNDLVALAFDFECGRRASEWREEQQKKDKDGEPVKQRDLLPGLIDQIPVGHPARKRLEHTLGLVG